MDEFPYDGSIIGRMIVAEDALGAPQADGLAGAEAPETHSRLGPTDGIPSAVTIPGELYAFLMGAGPIDGTWFGDLNRGLRGRFWWRALLRCAAAKPDAQKDGPNDRG